ncbi:MAG: Ig-like domain-containing protein, partial [Bacteroidota bacterium]
IENMKIKQLVSLLFFMTFCTLNTEIDAQIDSTWLRAEMYTVPISAENNLGTANLSWQVIGSESCVVTVDKGTGETDFAQGGATCSAVAEFIEKGVIHFFRLYKTDGTNRILVDSIRISGTDPLTNSSIGMNVFPLFIQYLGISQDNNDYTNEAHRRISKAMAKKSIISAAEIGTKYLRFMVSGFYSPTLNVLQNDPDFFWNTMNELMAEIKANSMKIIPSFGWNLFQFPDYFDETTTDFIADSNSKSYLMFKQFITDFVTKYRDENIVLFYEIGNEYNLYADLKIQNHPFTGKENLGRFTTVQLSGFQKRTANYIRSLDPEGMVTSGNGIPRYSSYHLMQQPQFSPEGPDFTHDSVSEFKEYLNILEEGMDIISVHLYNHEPDGNQRFGINDKNSADVLNYMKSAADEMGKLLFIGEFGDYEPMIQQNKTVPFTQNVLNKIVELDIPFSAPWVWDFYQFKTYEFTPFQIEQGFTDLIIEKYKQANVDLGNEPVIVANPDTVKPLVVLTYPKGDTCFTSPTQLVHAVASDNSGKIAKVEFYVNGKLVHSDTEPPYQFKLNTDGLKIENTDISTAAYDLSGNIANSKLKKYLYKIDRKH